LFLALGNNNQVKEITEKSQQEILADPQILNSYSYANNNPIVNSDPSGKNPWLIGWMLFGDPMVESAYSDTPNPTQQHIADVQNTKTAFFISSFLVPGEKSVNLVEHEGVQIGGKTFGHTIQEHVGKATDYLLQRFMSQISLKTASTFTDLETANTVAAKMFNEHATGIAKFLEESKIGQVSKPFTSNIGEKVGTFVNKGSDIVHDAYSASMRLVKSEKGQAIIHTMFVHN